MTPQDPDYYNEFVRRLAGPIQATSDEFQMHWNAAIATLIVYTIEKGGRSAFEVMAYVLDQSASLLPEHEAKASDRRRRQIEKRRLKYLERPPH